MVKTRNNLSRIIRQWELSLTVFWSAIHLNALGFCRSLHSQSNCSLTIHSFSGIRQPDALFNLLALEGPLQRTVFPQLSRCGFPDLRKQSRQKPCRMKIMLIMCDEEDDGDDDGVHEDDADDEEHEDT